MLNFFLSCLIIFSPFHPFITHAWHTEFEKAQEEALRTEKPILLVFSGSDWCKPCIRLKEEVFESTGFKAYAVENFSLLNIDFPRRRKHQVSSEIQVYRNSLAAKYNPRGLFPLILILDPSGKVKTELVYKGGGLDAFLADVKK